MDSNKYGLVNLIEDKNKPLSPLVLFPLSPKITIAERKMARQKQRWTREEEEALSDGVSKYGQGKWKWILTDPQFAPSLINRSNIDLKDKWRNMTTSSLGSTSLERVRNPISGPDRTMNVGPSAVLEGPDLNLTENGVGSSSTNRVGNVPRFDLNLPICPPEPSFEFPVVVYGGPPEPSRSTVDRRADRRADPDYEAMIFEALSTIQDLNGLDETAILNFIEERYELPQNYIRSVISKLRRLVLVRELEKVGNRYKYKTSG